MISSSFFVFILMVLLVVYLNRAEIAKLFDSSTGTDANKNQVDYSFGLEEALAAGAKIQAGQFAMAERIIRDLNADNLVQVLDYIGLTFDEEQLKAWHDLTQSDIAKLVLGVFYNHQAWLSRTHAFANEVSTERMHAFLEYQEICRTYLEAIQEPNLLTETNCRLIRVYMGNGLFDKAVAYYHKVIEADEDNLWAYVRYVELIQPKWGGSLELISDLLDKLPRRKIAQQLIELKLIQDSFVLNQNYFGGSMKDLTQRAKQAVERIDKEVSEQPPNTIHRYMVYNYLMGLADDLGKNKLANKNFRKMNGYYTLYPFGLMK